MASACAKCGHPLFLEISPSDDESDIEMESSSLPSHISVPDDVKLPCGEHLHWECLLDSYEHDKCPTCGRSIVTYPPSTSLVSPGNQTGQLIVDLNNEGGLQIGIDIMPILKEQSYLRAYPEETKCRAFLEFCREGDYRAVVDLLKSTGEDSIAEADDQDDIVDGEAGEEPSRGQKTADEILRYQDPIGDMQSGLHAAVANGHREIAWLILLLASTYPQLEFPALVYQEAAALGIMRETQEGKVDIRSLRDSHGRTAEDLARQDEGSLWKDWIGNGRLAMPDENREHGM